jgi:hypothetical protein
VISLRLVLAARGRAVPAAVILSTPWAVADSTPAQPNVDSCPRNNKNYRKNEKGLPRNIHARY